LLDRVRHRRWRCLALAYLGVAALCVTLNCIVWLKMGKKMGRISPSGSDASTYKAEERDVPRGIYGMLKNFVGFAGRSGLGSTSTADDAIAGWDGDGKVAIVTGPYTGIGLETSRALASKGCEVIMAGRGKERGEKIAKSKILARHPKAKVRVMDLDLASMKSVQRFSREFLRTGLPLNILVNNAGVMSCPFTLSPQGHELQFATNHLGHFLLTRLLLNHMKKSSASSKLQGRIVNVSSSAHRVTYDEGILDEQKLHDKSCYNGWRAYGQSKFANVLFSRELQCKLDEDKDANVASVSIHPGVIKTELQRHLPNVPSAIGFLVAWPFLKTMEQGAATQVYCATADANDIIGGQYYANCNLAASTAQSKDRRLGQKLWELSTEYCKEFLP